MEGETVLGFTGDGARLVTSVADGLVVRAFPSGFVLSRIPGLGWGSSPAISPDGALIVSSNHPILGTILVRSLMRGEVVREHRGGEPVVSTLFAAGGQVLYATPVSYTHLDVYKRQVRHRRPAGGDVRGGPAHQ